MTTKTNKPEGFDKWLAEIQAYGQKEFCYDQSEMYEESEMIGYFKDGYTPKDWCEWQAEKYGLDRTSGPWGF